MIIIIKIIWESVKLAIQQLLGNKLRTFLSLLGITIGVFCVISVLSAVDSMEYSIKNSFNELGQDVVYVDRMPWNEDPSANWWKYSRRPEPNYRDFKILKRFLKHAEFVAYGVGLGSKTMEYGSSSVSGVSILATTYEYADMFSLKFLDGRYFSPSEYRYGASQIILGYVVAENLFGNAERAVGRKVKVLGRKMTVLGVLEKEGKDLLNPLDFDEIGLLAYPTARKVMTISKDRGGFLNAKAASGVGMEQLKDEMQGVLRAGRRLKPREEDNFSLNQISLLTGLLDSVFVMMKTAGWIIGLFSMVVGLFNVANIMFVSVKERTNMIGVKKALGAKQYVILLEFLVEAIILCILGGALGLLIVYIGAYAATSLLDFHIFLSTKNIIIGTATSAGIGVVAGILPAKQAAAMDPVVAIRQ